MKDETMYGERGWTDILGTVLQAETVCDDYWHFSLPGDVAAKVLPLIPEDALEDRQNNGPSLRTMLQAAIDCHEATLNGYVIGKGRFDERITCDSICLPLDSSIDAEREGAWRAACAAYRLDPSAAPDDVRIFTEAGTEWIYMWWD